jgi:hypothetical protein
MNLRLIATLVAGGLVLAAAATLYWKGRLEGAARERPKVEAALERAAISGLETRGELASARRVDIAARQREAAARTVADITEVALKSEDADAPLETDRAERLRLGDQRLCDASPALAGCAADRNAGGGQAIVRALPIARGGDAR